MMLFAYSLIRMCINIFFITLTNITINSNNNVYLIRFKKEVYFYCTEQKNNRPKYENYFAISDLEGFISIYLYFGVVKMRNIRDYWNLGKNCRANKPEESNEELNIRRYLDSKMRVYK